MALLGVDTGGTFTDFVYVQDGVLRVHKCLSTPGAPEQAILQGISDLETAVESLAVVHGSTVATNAVLEGKGARCAFVTNEGLQDMLSIGRQAREHLYDLQPPRPEPPVARALCFGTGGRLDAEGVSIEPLSSEALETLCEAVAACDPQAVAICQLFSFLDASAEQAIQAALQERLGESVFICHSAQVLPEYKEYERAMATWLNAYVGPLMQGYLQRLDAALRPAPLAVMQSSGDRMDSALAGRSGVRMLLSGPAGGLQGAMFIGRKAGREQLLTFDMGGTSTDVALLDGGIRLTSEGHLGRYPVAVSQVDMHTIGAGGGSIAWIDAGGLLQVGPESAGARPGPACYGQGGAHPTVTDANLVLGRLSPDAFLGGQMQLDVEAAHKAVASVAEPLGMTLEACAEGIVSIANENMAHALRVISVQKGEDPAGFTLMSFGGAGGLHVCALAESLGMNKAMVPVHAGVLSALGMLAAPAGRELSRTHTGNLGDMQMPDLDACFTDLATHGREAMQAEGLQAADVQIQRSVDLRYRGQSYSLRIAWGCREAMEEAFHAAHALRFGHRMDEAVELVNIRVHVHGPDTSLDLPLLAARESVGGEIMPSGESRLVGVLGQVPVYARAHLCAGDRLPGPVLITEMVSTTYIGPDWQMEVDVYGNLLLERAS